MNDRSFLGQLGRSATTGSIPSNLWPPVAVRPLLVDGLMKIPRRYTHGRFCVFHRVVVCHEMVPRDGSVVLGPTLSVSTGAPAISVVGLVPVLTNGSGCMCGGELLCLKRGICVRYCSGMRLIIANVEGAKRTK